jgi:hemerythrin-like domain-containing protein
MSDTAASDLLRADHRKMEKHLDALLDALKHLSAERVAEIRRDFAELEKLAEIHFDQEERVYYPRVRALAPQVMDLMEEQHGVVRETERGLHELLESFSDPATQRSLDELHRIGIEFHDAVEVHIIDEEDQLLKLADRMLTTEEQIALAAAMRKVAGAES